MEEKLISRLESAVTRLESLSAGGFSGGGEISRDASAAGPSIAAFDDLISQYVTNVISVAENIGGQVLDISKVIEEAFNVQKELLVEISQTQVNLFDSHKLHATLLRCSSKSAFLN